MTLRAAIRADARGNQAIKSALDAAGALQMKDDQGAGRWVERMLRLAGFDPGKANALKSFQAAWGLTPSGKLDRATFEKLKATVERVRNTQQRSPTHRVDTFGLGQRSERIELAERRLSRLGYQVGKVDDVFDRATQAASRDFERKYPGTGHNGAIGKVQLERMRLVLRAKQHPGSGPTLKAGDRGGPVKKLQQRLERLGLELGNLDGDFGPRTRKAVKHFQRSRGLETDGVVGQKTWRALGIKVRGQVNHPGGSAPVGSGYWPGITPKMQWAGRVAVGMGLTVTSTTGGTHAPTSYHYSGRAIDVAGPPSLMARYYRYMASKRPTELFYDPIGGIKYGSNIGAIGGHSDHVHIAF